VETLTQETNDGMTATQPLSELIAKLGNIPKVEAPEEIHGDYFKSERYREQLQRKADYYNQTPGILENYDCKKCLNKGVVAYVTEDLTESCKPCECMAIRDCINGMKASGIDKAVFDNYTFDKYIANEQWQIRMKSVAQNYLKTILSGDTQHWLLMSGQSGSGKTHLSTAVCYELIKSGHKVKYMIWTDIVNKLTQLKYKETDYSGFIRSISDSEILYIDDLFKTEKPHKELVFEVINSRYISRKPTIISCETNLEYMFDIDTAVAGRISQMSKGFACQIKNDESRNYRRKL
jgi:DNA replication protein DnaC